MNKPYDIARSLGRIVRFTGRTQEPVSVLNHVMSGAFYALAKWNDGGEAALAFLVHDSAEAICGEIPKGHKTDDQKLHEDEVQSSLLAEWGITVAKDTSEAVDWLDKAIVKDEANEYGLKEWTDGDSGDTMLRRIVRDMKVKYPFGDHPELCALFHEVVTTKNANLLDLLFK